MIKAIDAGETVGADIHLADQNIPHHPREDLASHGIMGQNQAAVSTGCQWVKSEHK